MRMLLPGLRERRSIRRLLGSFFNEHRQTDFDRAITAISRFYRLKRPKIEWFEYLDWGKTVGRTYTDGKIHLVHPENWKRGRKYNTERQWVNAVYHEMGHYILWSDPERKADTFAARMEPRFNGGARFSMNGQVSANGQVVLRRTAAGSPRRRLH